MGRGSVRHQPRASSPSSWRSAAVALLFLAALALADVSQLDEDLTFDEEALGVSRVRREAEVAPVAPPFQETSSSAKATLTKRQAGWGFWGSNSDDEDEDLGSAVEGSGAEKIIYRVKFQVNLIWSSDYNNKQGSVFQGLANDIISAFRIILRSVSGEKTLYVSNMKRTLSGYVEVTMDINYEGFGDQSGVLKRTIREALATSRLGSIPVNTQFFSFVEHGMAVATSTCPDGMWRCPSGRCVGRCDGRKDCLDESDEKDCITSSSSSSSTSEGCPADKFSCDQGSVCLELSDVCNGRQDCFDATDEQGCSTVVPCRSDEFKCNDGSCVASFRRCDYIQDCPDGEDEAYCPGEMCENGEYTCRNGECIPISQRCDGLAQCRDQSDESGCPCNSLTEWQCDDAECIDRRLRCDGKRDCPYDNSDERDCPYTCRPDQFRCENGECLDANQRCNGREECNRGEDERGCACGPSEFTCVSSGLCINEFRRCDGNLDCRDGSDEQGCALCHPVEEWQCANGQCIPSRYRCDGRQDCADNSDELDARCIHNRECTADEFKCNDGGCIEKEWRCDSVPDCADASDEIDCCRTNEFKCGDGYCIPDYKKCDGTFDCTDGSDERGDCECSEDEFQCGDGTCIPRYQKCNGLAECLDGSDEQNCHLYQCADGNYINDYLRCDGRRDCSDGSDEEQCTGTVSVNLRTYPSEQTIQQSKSMYIGTQPFSYINPQSTPTLHPSSQAPPSMLIVFPYFFPFIALLAITVNAIFLPIY